MLIHADVSIPFPRPLVYFTYRDQLMDLLPYIPNIRSVEVKSRYEENQHVYSVNLWHGGGNMPLTLKAVIGDALVSWIEYNTWNESDFTLEWRIETKAFTEAIFCAGKNHFLEENGKTIIQTRGELKIDPKKINGLSAPLKGKVAHLVENFLGKKIVPNLIQMGKGVHDYLEKKVN
ncbi:unknown [Crocosphaera subtropica ATCC 51142]|uniref:Coenzyme Q-binding protein COQ10 START domain-containing protein n=1 Tax=Crocosphaera subtropica (strain ATCC 51142 / BH68) TaxID=43989 RepID=B1WQM5_CROS5|nr:hypothetical protein [Crocosphaera subtropica]ACB51736.1 unknown [Crocosphaera subtropica ATCC 51142]